MRNEVEYLLINSLLLIDIIFMTTYRYYTEWNDFILHVYIFNYKKIGQKPMPEVTRYLCSRLQ